MVAEIGREPEGLVLRGAALVVNAETSDGKPGIRIVLGTGENTKVRDLGAICTVATLLAIGCVTVRKAVESGDMEPVTHFPLDRFQEEVEKVQKSAMRAFAEAAGVEA